MRPLDGIRVLDLSRVLSGPHCGRMLADLGADVIKLEPPEGDLTRRAQPQVAGISLYYTQQNCGKRNVSIDLRRAQGAALALELAARSDVVIENFRPAVMDRLGLGYETVRARNPRVVYCSITGWGSSGPNAGRRAYAPVIHAEAGFMELAARKRQANPVSEAVSHADLYAGVEAAAGVLAALFARERTGEGRLVEVSMAQALLYVNEWTSSDLVGIDARRAHPFGGYHAPVLRLGDGTWVCVPGDPIATWPLWCEAMGRPDLLEDERFSTWEARWDRRADLLGVLREFAAGFGSADELEERLAPARLAVGRVQSAATAATGPWAEAAGALAEVDDRGGGNLRVPAMPLRFSGLEAGPHGGPAYQGEHNRDVLAEVLGMDAEEVERLTGEGVLVERPGAGGDAGR